MVSVLVTDGENRSALAAVRSLGKKGYRVLVTGSSLPCIASISKFCNQAYQVPDLRYKGVTRYASSILSIIVSEKVNIVLPMTDKSVFLLNQIRTKLPENIVLACPPAETANKVCNKVTLFQLAERHHVPVPHTWYLSNPGDLGKVMKKITQYPVVIKPAMSWVLDGEKFAHGGVQYAGSPADLRKVYWESPVLQYPSMIQEKIIGPGTGLFTLFDRDRHLALFSHQRLREKPPSGGVSVVSQSIELDEEMVEYSRRLLAAVEWEGVAMVEFKRDLRNGNPCLMEINGRFWGTLQLAIACGVDFPGLLVDRIRGKKCVSPVYNYKKGHKMKWFLGTMDHLIIRLKNGNRNLPVGAPSKLRSITDFATVFEKNTSFDVFDSGDILPFFIEAKNYIGRAIGVRK